MKRGMIFLAAVALGAGIGGCGRAPAAEAGGERRPASLAAEYALAREGRCYFVIDLAGGTVDLKAKDVVMRRWTFRKGRFWGRPDFPASLEIARKSALRAPERFEIKPAAEAEDSTASDPAGFELDALELPDMPGRFTLHSKNGIRISVRTRARSLGERIVSTYSSVAWYGLNPVRHLFQTIRGRPGFAIEVVFDEKKDAQSVYWTFFEGIKGLIY